MHFDRRRLVLLQEPDHPGAEIKRLRRKIDVLEAERQHAENQLVLAARKNKALAKIAGRSAAYVDLTSSLEAIAAQIEKQLHAAGANSNWGEVDRLGCDLIRVANWHTEIAGNHGV